MPWRVYGFRCGSLARRRVFPDLDTALRLGPAYVLYEVVPAHLVDGVGPDVLGGTGVMDLDDEERRLPKIALTRNLCRLQCTTESYGDHV
jgi:hypothetical protein